MAELVFSGGCTPDEIIKSQAQKECPEGFSMTLKSQDDWTALSEAWNIGIDSHLEAMVRSSANPDTGRVLLYPNEVHVFCRRLNELNADEIWPDWDYEVENNPAENLRSAILASLGIEEV